MVIDLQSRSASQLLNAPVLFSVPLGWRGHTLFLDRTYLPLDVGGPSLPESRKTNTYCAEIQVPTLEVRESSKEVCSQWNRTSVRLDVAIKQGLNTPPKLFAIDSASNQKIQLLDLNPEFANLDFGKVANVEWKANGIELVGVLYFPPDYSSAKQYPLVIQTHGYDDDSFSMDGRSEWSSGFAARALAAKGFLVLQTYAFKNEKDHDRVAADRSLGATDAEAFKSFSALVYESAIDSLDQKRMIDRARVAISGFSRTVCFVAFTLTHTTYKFAAATLTDGIDCSYFSYLSFPDGLRSDTDNLNGELPPTNEQGLKQWVQKAPGFNLDKVKTAVRLVAIGPVGILENWEWFVGLSLQNRPVELVEIPAGVHILQRPWDRRIAMQGIVDWFRFWLKEEEDLNPDKEDEYLRWRQMRLAR